ncbi:hypothetical protein [Aurantibacter sp.]|uniref:hypothetical protein n=1 Tax=Aurantibacter sp. TaxID=2807103 RepID=UPI0032660C76
MKLKFISQFVFFTWINQQFVNRPTRAKVVSDAYDKLWNPTPQDKIDKNIDKYRNGTAKIEIGNSDLYIRLI